MSNSQIPILERGLAIYISEGLRYYMNRDPILHHQSVIEYISSLYNRWHHLHTAEKEPWLERAREEVAELRQTHQRGYDNVLRRSTRIS